METKYRYTVWLTENGTPVKAFEYTDYEDVQNLIGYMVDGARILEISIHKTEVKSDDK